MVDYQYNVQDEAKGERYVIQYSGTANIEDKWKLLQLFAPKKFV